MARAEAPPADRPAEPPAPADAPPTRPNMWVRHLKELRRRAIISALAVVAGTIVAFLFHATILHALTQPYCALPSHDRLLQGQCTLIVTGVLDAFRLTIKLCLFAGILLSSPVWLYQLWRFITPGLHQHERRYASWFVGISVLLFGVGVAFAWETLTRGLQFLLGFATGGVASLLSFDSYLSFVTAMVLIFGVSFEFPLLIVSLNLVGVLSAVRLRKWSRFILFGIVVFAGGATPSPDPLTMLALAAPLALLYGGSLIFAIYHDRRKARNAVAEIPDDQPSVL
ncbi:twin-arginine translocase subunit TatC [Cryptosporangium phraense]|uniref:Sec-independent protein translocase protein TatC n=1 Tax=Cryptosporangium phraense TaxID=2593070 RepID=A0A545AF72_9ACTN|nr:twin-arginine translocase subunit TatC [Cryptosporangium phraense]TQS39959.1 twin-arginine translocase subunit TatC [Cryptosporangium phraense]